LATDLDDYLGTTDEIDNRFVRDVKGQIDTYRKFVDELKGISGIKIA